MNMILIRSLIIVVLLGTQSLLLYGACGCGGNQPQRPTTPAPKDTHK